MTHMCLVIMDTPIYSAALCPLLSYNTFWFCCWDSSEELQILYTVSKCLASNSWILLIFLWLKMLPVCHYLSFRVLLMVSFEQYLLLVSSVHKVKDQGQAQEQQLITWDLNKSLQDVIIHIWTFTLPPWSLSVGQLSELPHIPVKWVHVQIFDICLIISRPSLISSVSQCPA